MYYKGEAMLPQRGSCSLPEQISQRSRKRMQQETCWINIEKRKRRKTKTILRNNLKHINFRKLRGLKARRKKFQYKYRLNLCPIQPLYDIGTETRMNLKLRLIRAGLRSEISRLIKKFEDIQQEENGTLDTEDLSNILDILSKLDDGDIKTEIIEVDEYTFNLEGKICQVNKLILVKTTLLNTHAESFAPRLETTQPFHTINSSYTEHQNNSNYS
ncbi:unnamed protein product [Mytilus coruscus]|uniref:Uncharacterized protein n=1 Tax=Mytilus coruscus TaxID=42192 RepID=A0A6J8DZZ3_MYTCO|nr:unnamed protein product [Mytilus coruscus]